MWLADALTTGLVRLALIVVLIVCVIVLMISPVLDDVQEPWPCPEGEHQIHNQSMSGWRCERFPNPKEN